MRLAVTLPLSNLHTAPPPYLQLACVHDFDLLEAEWQALEAQGHCTAFQTLAWMRPFYRELAPSLGLEPVFIRVSDAVTNQVLMLWPLVRRRRLGIGLVEFADLGVSDYNAPLLAAQWPGQPLAQHPAWHALWREVCRRLRSLSGLGVALQLEKAPLRIGAIPNPQLSALGAAEALPIHDLWAQAQPQSFGAWAVALPDNFAQYQAQALSPSFQKDLALRSRRLTRKGPVRFALANTPQARQQAFDALARQRARRFAETGRDDILAKPLFRRFYQAAAVDAPDQTVRLFTLSVGDTIVAVLLALDHAGTRHVVMPTFEAGEWKNCSPGNLVLLMAIEDAIARGLQGFDFTIGDEPYKASFGAVQQPVFGLVQPLSLGGAAFAGARLGARRVRDWWRGQATAAADQPPDPGQA